MFVEEIRINLDDTSTCEDQFKLRSLELKPSELSFRMIDSIRQATYPLRTRSRNL